ncbi:adenylosuccinate lyase family protein [Solirubrobacter ginsenosidimutans]|uniref:Adenylosuccinate lyase family protein n=1 Tax=Solirubrobacter ginsenosidimutans TaxID=490573 RepID=A0A9X3MR72_9ACTN|nr:adenylosuccinate lyase family protein [Solirubrobacter ginsenosidimutans]MDA0159680.1 adenylosuccinate lyase family protein [Solirubrobacter ginsenosidimutans]
MSGIDLADSVIYGHLWATDETRALLGDAGRTSAWVRIIAALAEVQGELGVIPEAAAAELARLDGTVDLEAVGEETRASGHSTLGLIRVLRRGLGPEAAEWIYYGATVQDVTDTWFGLVMRDVLDLAERELLAIETALLRRASEHRDTPMLGRTHGQPGLPITFGFKAAVWAAEVGRHLDRIGEARPRLAVGQLAGAVGTLSAWGDAGPELQRRLMSRLGLGVPETSWLTARDRIAEYVTLLALVTGTLAKIGNEVYNLQRPELGELSEAPTPGVVGSITMPQKRNPERSEHLWTLARLVRSDAGLALEGLVGEHERDGAAWKTEWAIVPQATAAAATALTLARELVEGLRVDARRMQANLDAQRGYVLAEPAMLALAQRVGKHRAHELVQRAALAGQEADVTFAEALAADPEIAALLPQTDLRVEQALGAARTTVDDVIARRRSR